jgi:hypothetical protein
MFTDKDEDWPIWEIDFEGWSIRKGFKRLLKRKDPKTTPWADRSYTVTSMDDPSGDIGVYIRYESRSDYVDRCDEYMTTRMRHFGQSSWGLWPAMRSFWQ